MFTVSGSPVEAVVEAVKTVLLADATLVALVTSVYGYVPAAARTVHPYVKIGEQALYPEDFGSMGLAGGRVTFPLDSWSESKGPHAMRVILSRIYALLERRRVLALGQYTYILASLHCTLSIVIEEPDEDMPEKRLFHGRQQWEALVEEQI